MLTNSDVQAEAALVFAGGQLLFRWNQEGVMHAKLVSPAAVRVAFSTEPLDSGWLPPYVRRWGTGPSGKWAILVVPRGRYRLNFTRMAPRDPQPVETLEIPLPSLVFACSESGCYVWALKRDFAPTAELYHAPLPNVYGTGAICFGGNRVDKQDAAKAWAAFVELPFNADLVNGKSLHEPKDVRRLLVRLAGKSRFPLSELVQVSPRQDVNSIVRLLCKYD